MSSNVQFRLKNDTAANWVTNNPVLAAGELGYDSTANAIKFGDGTAAWRLLRPVAGTYSVIKASTAINTSTLTLAFPALPSGVTNTSIRLKVAVTAVGASASTSAYMENVYLFQYSNATSTPAQLGSAITITSATLLTYTGITIGAPTLSANTIALQATVTETSGTSAKTFMWSVIADSLYQPTITVA